MYSKSQSMPSIDGSTPPGGLSVSACESANQSETCVRHLMLGIHQKSRNIFAVKQLEKWPWIRVCLESPALSETPKFFDHLDRLLASCRRSACFFLSSWPICLNSALRVVIVTSRGWQRDETCNCAKMSKYGWRWLEVAGAPKTKRSNCETFWGSCIPWKLWSTAVFQCAPVAWV